jgi:lipoprotein-anchoring transpeptidase ErfK/SrfK
VLVQPAARFISMSAAHRRPTLASVTVATATMLAILGGCSGQGFSVAAGPPEPAVSSPPASTATTEAAAPIIQPAANSTDVRPDTVVTVTAGSGKLVEVTATRPDGRPVAGSLSEDAGRWTSTAPLPVAETVMVRAVEMRPDGDRTVVRSRFSTLTPAQELTTSISPLDGQTVGVGMPVIVRLSHPVVNRAAVLARLAVRTSVAVEGAWRWVDDTELHWRPRAYWPAGVTATLTVMLAGVDAGHGVWGQLNRVVTFTTGASMVSVVDVAAHTLTVRRDGELLRVIDVTTGKAGFLTRNGVKVVSEKHRMKIMDAATTGISRSSSEYYRLEVPLAMRVSNSGEFVHAAPWSTGSQGRANVSHGCVGMSMADARWLYELSRVGDIIEVVNSPRPISIGNGWTDWNIPWQNWTAGGPA